ncbi:MAG: hypothetical protein LBI04_04635 [Treponema sp.]|nr:hypothetical protein [Treponema sp.]
MPYLTSIFTQDHIIWLAEAANVCRANRFSFSATQNGILCMLPAEIYNDGEYFAAFSIHIKSTDFSNIKNVIPQVLRI